MNKGADYEVVLGWSNLRNTEKVNMHKRRFQNKPYCLCYKDTDKNELSIRFLNYLKR